MSMDFELRIRAQRPDDLAGREWMVTNGLGGYAAGTLGGGCSRRHDGLLVAALDSPFGRTIMLDRVDETVRLADGSSFALFDCITEFRLEWGLPIWRFARAGLVIERRLVMPWRQNTTIVQYRLLEGDARVTLDIKPWHHVRGNDGQADQPMLKPMLVQNEGSRIEISHGAVTPLRLAVDGPDSLMILDGGLTIDAFYPIEAERDYVKKGPLWSPGHFTVSLGAGGVTVLASTESWVVARALSPDDAFAAETERRRRLVARADAPLRKGMAAQLVLAADAFIFQPQGRPALYAQAHARGDEICSVIAGYPWFNDWGRDTMISLEGLTLVTGRGEEARWILRTFAQYVKDGLIPDNIPDGQGEPVYHACDATLWFFHAVDRYVARTGDRETLDIILPKLLEVIEHHRRGTRFNIGVDPADGLLREGVEGYMLTWMDSDTPRRGKPVEINALWYNALCCTARWLAEAGDAEGSARAAADAARCKDSFNRRFWNPATTYLYDLVDGENGDDAACRCNQIFAISLPNPVLDPARWPAVVQAVKDRLLTPYGLRSLSREAADYRPGYVGDLHSRDVAYHRGTVWAWLIGPYVDAWLKVNPTDQAGARAILEGFSPHLRDFLVGSIAEVFDGDAPHAPRGCTAQAWSVAEVLRAWSLTG
jgi:predicted glycogen debranching enzyme